MKYGKLICGALVVPENYPCSIELNGVKVYNPTDEQYAEAGYLPIMESQPEERDGKVAVASYSLDKTGKKIVQSWEYYDEEPIEPAEGGE